MTVFSADVRVRECPSWTVTLYISGCIAEIRALLAREAAERGACWSVEPTEFIYSGGREQGVVVRRIAYARFPSSADEALRDMVVLGQRIMEATGQGSFSVIGPEKSVFVSRRLGDAE